MFKQIRQGDILLVNVPTPVEKVARLGKADSLVLGYGEVTGHHHVLENAIWLVGEEVTQNDLHQFALGNKVIPVFVVVEAETELTHEEHETLVVDPGIWQVIRQREYSPESVMSVRD